MLKPKKPVKMMPYKVKVDPKKKPSPGMSKSKDKMSIDDIIKHSKKTKNMPRLKKGGMSCSCKGKGCMKCGGKKHQDGGEKGRIARLSKKEDKLVYRGNKAVDEGRDKKADRILGRAAKVENRLINVSERKAKKAKK
jgi:hypothetical protein